MSTTPRIPLDLPADLYARIREAAARSDRPVESVLVKSLDLLFSGPSIDGDHLATIVDTLSDAQLWAIVHRRVTWSGSARLRELTVRGKETPLSDEEQAELVALIEDADRITLHRSQALLMLQQRGFRIHDPLPRGA